MRPNEGPCAGSVDDTKGKRAGAAPHPPCRFKSEVWILKSPIGFNPGACLAALRPKSEILNLPSATILLPAFPPLGFAFSCHSLMSR